MNRNYKVLLDSPCWSLNGVNVFSANLARGLGRLGIDARILITRPDYPDLKPMPRPQDICFENLFVRPDSSWRQRWKALVTHLESAAPCLYLPNYDFGHSCAAPRLSSKIGVIGIVHSDDPMHYAHARALGKYWNAVVAVSGEIANQLHQQLPGLADRVQVITYGVEVPPEPPVRAERGEGPIRIFSFGVIRQEQKRIFDLIAVLHALRARGVFFKLTVAGDGPERSAFMEAASEFAGRGEFEYLGIVPNHLVPSILAEQDVFIMTSDYEGLPNALLEAMAHGCAPVVTDIRSGIPELVTDGENGFLVPVGDIAAFADRIARLAQDPELRLALSRRAHAAVIAKGHRIEDMTLKYLKLFDQVMADAETGKFRRPRGRVALPRFVRASWKDYLPEIIRSPARRAKNLIKKFLG